MPPVCIMNDIGVGTSVLPGIPIPMSGMVLAVNGGGTHLSGSAIMPVAVLTDMVIGGDGSVGVIIAGVSATNTTGNLSKALVGATFSGVFTGSIVGPGSVTHQSL